MTSEQILKAGALFKQTINLADAFDKSDKANADAIAMMTKDDGKSHYVVMREMTSAEMLDVRGLEPDDVIKELEKKLNDAIVDHSFIMESGNKTPNGDVAKIIKQSAMLVSYVMGEWMNNSPLAKQTAKDSAKQAG